MTRNLWFVIGACMCASVSAHASTWDKLDAALNELAKRSGTTVDRLRVDPAASGLENDRFGTLRLQKYLMAEPQRAPSTIEAMSKSLANPSSLEHPSGVASRLEVLTHLSWEGSSVPHPLNIQAVKLPDDKSSNAVVDAMKRLYAGTGKRFQGKERTKVIEDSRQFSPELRTQMAALIDAVAEASRMRESVVKSSELKQGGAFDGKSKRTAGLLRDFLNRWWAADLTTDPKMSRLIFALETFDLNALYVGAIPLAHVLDTAADNLLEGQRSVHADWQTPLGRIAVGGKGNDSYEGPYALIVDLGGNDTYRGSGAASGQDPVALILDLGGDDHYAAGDSAMAGPGGAVLGYAGIEDAGSGKDTYEATSWAGGFGCLGVGWIDDRGGDDTYRMQLFSQGAALFGIGLLVDESGDDQFRLETRDAAFSSGQSQGFGGPMGIGTLIDVQGNDTYVDADSLSILDEAVHGWVQGSAWGGWGKHWSGGLGWLLDESGDDTYQAMFSAQGAGDGSGLGVLANESGNDEYSCGGFGQGSGGNLGTGILYDGAGRDRYRAADASMGFGSDLGMGMLFEGSGDDTYVIEPREDSNSLPSVAGSFRQGAGWLVDLAGNDTYPAQRGQVDSRESMPWRAPVPGVSVLVDLGQPNLDETYTPPGGHGPAFGGMLILPAPSSGNSNPSSSSP